MSERQAAGYSHISWAIDKNASSKALAPVAVPPHEAAPVIELGHAEFAAVTYDAHGPVSADVMQSLNFVVDAPSQPLL